jgi:hypothetical protein
MELSSADVARLYGSKMLRVEEPPAATATSSPPLLPPAGWESWPVAWRMKPQASLALILSVQEFNNRSLTALLRDWVLAAGLSTERVGFGMLSAAPGSSSLSLMPSGRGIVFSGELRQPLPSPAEIGGKLFHFFPSLGQLAGAPPLPELLAALKSAS